MEAKEKDKCNTSENKGGIWFTFSRRNFLSLAGWGLFLRLLGRI